MPQKISLHNQNWQFGRVSPRPFTAATAFDLPTVAEWLPATVPGHIYLDLLAAGRIPSPLTAAGCRHSRWVEAADWWYRCAVGLDPLPAPRRAFVAFYGLDYLSAIFVNGQELARHEGMFSRQIIEVTEFARHGSFELAVRLWGSHALPRRRLSWAQKLWQRIGQRLYRSWVGIYPDRTATLKCQMSFGWDFAPSIRTGGIWDDVELRLTGPVVIKEVGLGGYQPGDDRLRLELALHAAPSTPVRAAVTIAPANFQGDAVPPAHFALRLPAGASVVNLTCPLPPVALWQPWDRGLPHLYHVTVTLAGPDGTEFDAVTRRTGFRAVEKRGWQFIINGQPEFMRGLNWVPADSLPGRLRRADYERLLRQARAANANLLRVWGGGLREKQDFYDLCDELGLLVWQEFPFACEFLGAFPRDRAYLDLAARECGEIVRQVRHHPAVVAWCGGNEFSRWRNRPLLATLAGVARQCDGSRPFIPTSPGPGDAHNWQVWHGGAPIAAYRQENAPFLSEFGLQSLPVAATLAQIDDLAAHHADLPKLVRYARPFKEPDNSTPVAAPNLPVTVYSSQLAQAVALQTAIEHMRRRKGQAGGVCVWQFNEPWPAVSWAIVDYFGRPKLAYERLKTWYAPVLVSLKFGAGQRWAAGDWFTAEIWLINDTLQPIANAAAQIALVAADAAPVIIHQLENLTLPADSAFCAGTVCHRLEFAPRALTATLLGGETALAANSYPLDWHDASPGSWALRLRRWLAHWALR